MIFVKNSDADPGDANKENARHHIYQSLLYQAIVGTVIWILCLVFIREKPPTPPSSSCENVTKDVIGNIIKVSKNKNALILIFTFGLILGFANTYGSVSGILVNSLGFDDKAASLFGTMFILGAIVGAGIFGTIVEIYKIYKLSTMIICGMGAISSGIV